MPYEFKSYGKGKAKVCKKNSSKCFSKKPLPKARAEAQMKALHANVQESLNECWEYKNTVVTDDKSEASVSFALTNSPGAELVLVFNLSPDANYSFGVIKDSKGHVEKFEDPLAAEELLKHHGLTPDDVENAGQEAYEEIEKQTEFSQKDGGVREESLGFEALFARIIES